MNRIEFYNRLNKFKKDQEEKETLQHRFSDRDGQDNKLDTNGNRPNYEIKTSYQKPANTPKVKKLSKSNNYGKSYYTKIDNYYPDGTARYFYSREEYEAYQNGQVKGSNAKYIDQIKKETAERKAAEAKKLEEEAKKKQQEETIKKNKAAAEAEAQREQSRIEGQKKADAKQTEEYKKQKEHEATIEQMKKETAERKKQKEHEETIEQIKKESAQRFAMKEAKKRAEEKTKQQQEKEKLELAKYEYKQNAEKIKANMAARQEKLNTWKENIKNEVNDYATEIWENIQACSKDRDTKFKVDNELVDLLKEKIKKEDPDFDGDIAAYVRPIPGKKAVSAFLGPTVGEIIEDAFLQDDEHTKLVKHLLNELEDDIDKEVDATNYVNANYTNYLDKIKGQKEEKKKAAITKEISDAKKSLEEMYKGDSDRFVFDDSLKKALNDKLAEIDNDYSGDIQKYVRPYLFGKWIKDDESYEKALKALDELESELKAATKKDEVYGEFIDKVTKLL